MHIASAGGMDSQRAPRDIVVPERAGSAGRGNDETVLDPLPRTDRDQSRSQAMLAGRETHGVRGGRFGLTNARDTGQVRARPARLAPSQPSQPRAATK
jgi:hypothetical protein